MGYDKSCKKCGWFRGHPNQKDGSFLCRSCTIGYDNSIEIAEAKLGA